MQRPVNPSRNPTTTRSNQNTIPSSFRRPSRPPADQDSYALGPPRCNRLAHFLKPRGFPASGAPLLVHVVIQVAGGSGGSGLFTSYLPDVDAGVEAVLVTECRGDGDGEGDEGDVL